LAVEAAFLFAICLSFLTMVRVLCGVRVWLAL
jgi:hypothetical protein